MSRRERAVNGATSPRPRGLEPGSNHGKGFDSRAEVHAYRVP
jgi:hypothetical protein